MPLSMVFSRLVSTFSSSAWIQTSEYPQQYLLCTTSSICTYAEIDGHRYQSGLSFGKTLAYKTYRVIASEKANLPSLRLSFLSTNGAKAFKLVVAAVLVVVLCLDILYQSQPSYSVYLGSVLVDQCRRN